jgi:hypothetical protein
MNEPNLFCGNTVHMKLKGQRVGLWMASAMVSFSATGLAEPAWNSSTANRPSIPPANASPLSLGIGSGLDLPDVVPVEVVGWSRYFGFRLFASPSIPFNVRVEMPDDLISSSKGVEIEHPALNFTLKATYGPNYGADLLLFPFGGNFMLDLGLSQRQLRLKGGVTSPMIIRPKGSTESITTKTQFGVNADAVTTATMLRGSMGWVWRIFHSGYMKLTLLGIATPIHARTDVEVEGVIDAPGVENDEIVGALAELKSQKEVELREKAQKESKPAEDLKMPVIGITVGYLF